MGGGGVAVETGYRVLVAEEACPPVVAQPDRPASATRVNGRKKCFMGLFPLAMNGLAGGAILIFWIFADRPLLTIRRINEDEST
jgi:hypothetical protein